MKMLIPSGGKPVLSLHRDNGTLPWLLNDEDWTEVATATNGPDYTTKSDIRILTQNVSNFSTKDWSNYYYTDDGSGPVAAAAAATASGATAMMAMGIM